MEARSGESEKGQRPDSVAKRVALHRVDGPNNRLRGGFLERMNEGTPGYIERRVTVFPETQWQPTYRSSLVAAVVIGTRPARRHSISSEMNGAQGPN